MNKKQTIITTALSLLIIILALLVSGRFWTRLDLTKHKSWTISPVSKKLSDEITDQVKVTYFVTDKLKKLYGFPGEIRDLLEEYVSFSRGKLSFAERDPAKEGLEAKMQELGIPYRQSQFIEKDQATFANVYSGILIEYQGKREVLPFVFRLDTLEYEITDRIRSLVREREKTIGIILGDARNAFNTDNGYQGMQNWLAQAGYKTQLVGTDDDIPDTLTGLFVIGGADVFEARELYRIDRYIQSGGKVFFAVSSVRASMDSAFYAEKREDKGLLAMLASYGAAVEPSLVLDASSLAFPGPPSYMGIRVMMSYPFFVRVRPEFANPDHPITSVFRSLDLYWPNPVTLDPPDGVTAAPLFTTTDRAWLQKENFAIDPEAAARFSADAAETQGVYTLAAALAGAFPSFWRDKPAPEGDALAAMPPLPSPSRVIVMGNVDFLIGNVDFVFNEFTQEQPNRQFAVLVADWLSNDDDIISIRNRMPATGMLDKIIDEDERLAAFSLVRLLNTALVPLIVLAAGVVLSSRRKRSAAREQSLDKEETNDL